MNHRFGRRAFAALSFFLLTVVASVPGQDLDDVTIAGRITDSNGLAIVGATVKATLVGTGAERTITTNDEGRYRIVELRPGIYKVAVSQTGFATVERTDLQTLSGQSVQLDIQLQPAGVTASQTVAVNDEALVVDTTRTVVGGTVTQLEIEELPNLNRNPLDLVLTLGGTSEEALSTRDLAEDRNSNSRVTPAEQGNFSLSGGASYSNNITIDGLDNNDDRSARDRFQPPLDAVAEVQVIRNQFSAEYGRASGGRVNLRTRAGTNTFRGRAFMYFRDDNLNANTWYNNSRSLPRLPLTEYNPGFWMGGPITVPGIYNGKDKTFFAVAYEHNTLQDTTLIDTYVPVVANPRFTLPAGNGTGVFCDNTLETPPCPTQVGEIAPYSVLYATPNHQNSVIARIDHKLFENNDITFGFQFGRKKNRRTSGTSTTRIEDALQARNVNTEAFNVTDNHVFGPSVVNQVRFQWSNFTPSYQTDNPLDPVVLIGYRNPDTNTVQTLIAGNSTASTLQNFADSRKEVRYQFQDSLTWIAGDHTIKTGFDIQNVQSSSNSLSDATGTYNFQSVFNFSQNLLSRYRQNFGTTADVNNTYWGIFANDEYRLLPNLTISYGLRYERETVLDDTNNFGPRAAVAWDPFKDGKTVVRAGAGVFYNRTLLRTVTDFIQNSLENLQSFDSSTITTTNNARANVLGAISQSFPDAFPTADELRSVIAAANCGTASAPIACSPNTGFIVNTGTAGNPLRSIEPGLRIPESYNFNIGFERELGAGLVLEGNYTYNKTAHLWREYNINVPIVPAGFNSLTDWLVANPYVFTNANNSRRTYVFYQGADGTTSGLSTVPNGTTACPTTGANSLFTTNSTCYVNLNTFSTSTASPSTAAEGVTTNASGGPVGLALEAVRQLRPNPNFDEMARVASLGNAKYHGLVLELRSRSRKLGYGFRSTMRAAYTLSKMEDDGLNNTSNAEINTDFSREWARSLQDRRHRFVFSGTFDTPSWLGKVRFSPIFRYGSSAPFNIGYGVDRNLNDQSTDRVIFNGDLDDLIWREPGSPLATELLSQFSVQPIGSESGNLPRNIGKGPSQYIFDINLSREWRFTERYRLRGNVEVGNPLNMAVFSYGSEFVDFIGPNASVTTRLGFLVPTRTYRPRDMRFGLRLDF